MRVGTYSRNLRWRTGGGPSVAMLALTARPFADQTTETYLARPRALEGITNIFQRAISHSMSVGDSDIGPQTAKLYGIKRCEAHTV